MARKAKAKKAHKYIVVWCDRKGKVRQSLHHKVEYACEAFRMAQADGIDVEMSRIEGGKDVTLLEWSRYGKTKAKAIAA